jgi:hypothetical protein
MLTARSFLTAFLYPFRYITHPVVFINTTFFSLYLVTTNYLLVSAIVISHPNPANSPSDNSISVLHASIRVLRRCRGPDQFRSTLGHLGRNALLRRPQRQNSHAKSQQRRPRSSSGRKTPPSRPLRCPRYSGNGVIRRLHTATMSLDRPGDWLFWQ